MRKITKAWLGIGIMGVSLQQMSDRLALVFLLVFAVMFVIDVWSEEK